MHLVEVKDLPKSATAPNASLAEGRRKVVTMMFADIVNSSSLVIGRDPEAANNTLLPMLQGMIYHQLMQIPGTLDVEVNLVWNPPWDPRTMASEDVKLALGIW